jgi:hypothetical protein
MRDKRCPLESHCRHDYSRREFIRDSAGLLAATVLLGRCQQRGKDAVSRLNPVRASGPGSTYTPRLCAAFVRRKEEYGMWWPGAVYDGEAARKMYTEEMSQTARRLEADFKLRTEPLYNLEEAQAWILEAEKDGADGLVLVMLDRQQHAWPTAYQVAESAIPSVIFSPLGTSFTTNTAPLAETPGCLVYSTDDFEQAAFGMRMLCASAKMRRSRCVVIKGERQRDIPLADLGITLRHVPARTFIEEYNRLAENEEISAMADDFIRRARKMTGATRQDVINGVKSYFVARRILEREGADAITMDCLGALADEPVSLPCISWSRMNDEGIPAACEADYGAVASQIMVQYLFGRPGFQQDPVADTSDGTIIGAHCSCPTRLNGFHEPSEPFDLRHHHGNRDAVPRTLWRLGQRVTCVDILPVLSEDAEGSSAGDRSEALISVGAVIGNLEVPPSGGCVVSVKVKFDSPQDVLSYPGFHQLFFYGDYGAQMKDFCRLNGLKARVV